MIFLRQSNLILTMLVCNVKKCLSLLKEPPYRYLRQYWLAVHLSVWYHRNTSIGIAIACRSPVLYVTVTGQRSSWAVAREIGGQRKTDTPANGELTLTSSTSTIAKVAKNRTKGTKRDRWFEEGRWMVCICIVNSPACLVQMKLSKCRLPTHSWRHI